MATITQWKILKILTKNKQGTQRIREALAQDGVDLTLRSIQRNLESLSGFFPITSDHLNPAGWRWAEQCELLDLPTMDGGTALTLKLSEQYLTEMLPKGCVSTLRPYVDRAHKLLDEIEGTRLGDWPKRIARISRQQSLSLPEVDGEVLDAVFQAVLEKKQLTISYQRLQDEQPADRELHPLGLVFDSGVIYLVATVWNYQDERQFALHRMVSAKVLDKKATQKKAFCLQQYIADNNFDFPSKSGPIRVKLQVSNWLARHLEERHLSEDQVITEQECGSLVEATVTDTAQLKWWLLGHGTKVEVLGPPALREAISKTIEELHGIYSETDPEGGD